MNGPTASTAGTAEPAVPADTPVTLLVADDDEVTRSGLRTLLAAQPGIVVIGEAADGVEVVEQARRLRPDVVLMDVRMPRRNGIEATRQLLAESTESTELPESTESAAPVQSAGPPKVVVITTFENDDYVTAALSAGASGFVLKRLPVRQIAEAVRVVAAGEAILFPTTLRRMVAARPLESAEALPKAALTVREEEVLRLVATGLSNPEIAESLTVSLETVKTHVGNVLTKLGAQNRTHAVVIAYESGLVVPGFTG
ncbi:response regulator transcription factor [Streptomyces sp. P9(2023)]|uniref:response regulator transcription factor n=1 Tax=Streptomyces sp. P9(2023) TaxID=3064394 RepID=UPI0028F447C0|nr:response regulator transcription factor [Streptomyces sp. P9(2023)]MDT9686985.1 response regulator transcription factor [Streptomyces sp. P9(2023)]